MLFLAELPWCLLFVHKINYQEKSRKICQKSYFTRRSTEPEYETEWIPRGTTHPCRAGVASPGAPSGSLFVYKMPLDLKTEGVDVFPERVLLRCHHQKPRFRTRNSV